MKSVPFLMILVPLISISQSLPRPEPPPQRSEALKPEDLCSVEGTVFNSATGDPLKKAVITLRPTGDRRGGPDSAFSGITDSTGHYSILGLEPGQYRMVAERTGFVSQPYGAKNPRQSGAIVSLGRAQKLKDADFRLIAQGVITGRVLDEDGDPMQNVLVSCMRQGFARGRKQWLPMNGQMTNDLGEYRIYSLPPGRYYISTTYRPGFQDDANRGVVDEGYAPTYYPSGPSPETASPLEVTAGAQLRNIDVHLQKTRTVRVTGRVVSASSAPVGRATMVRLLPQSESSPLSFMPRMSRVLDRNGRFAIGGVTAGSYWIVADSSDENGRLSGRASIDVGSTAVDDVTLTLSPGAELSGVVKMPEGAPRKTSDLRVTLEPKNSSMQMGGPIPTGVVAEDGKFIVKNVVPDSFVVHVYGVPENCYVKAVRFGDADVTESGVDFSSGVTAGEFVVSLSPGAGQASGSVQAEDQKPIAGVSVVLVPDGPRRTMPQYYKVVSTDQTGNYSIKGITPGEYRAYAFDEIDPGAYMDPDFLKPFEGNGERVTIKENGQESLQLKLIRPGTQ